MKLFRLSITVNFTKMIEDNISQLGDYDGPFCEQQYSHGSCYISLFNFKSFHEFNTPRLPQILDIYSVVAPQCLKFYPLDFRCDPKIGILSQLLHLVMTELPKLFLLFGELG